LDRHLKYDQPERRALAVAIKYTYLSGYSGKDEPKEISENEGWINVN